MDIIQKLAITTTIKLLMVLTDLFQLTGINQNSCILNIGRDRFNIHLNQNHSINLILPIAILDMKLSNVIQILFIKCNPIKT